MSSSGLLEWYTSLSVSSVGALHLRDTLDADGLGNDDDGLAVVHGLSLGDGTVDGSEVVAYNREKKSG